ncbi:hypothetical protein [Aliidiomarina halalkaliphila]|uniref:hypothetical protein n=1 Tax=Aliidiomarina halalkaliphila TaxID=2593535 RepID=UPI00163DBB82|nr:hypothetical protein [Aliidiomarina halalkaliphila]
MKKLEIVAAVVLVIATIVILNTCSNQSTWSEALEEEAREAVEPITNGDDDN